MATASDISLEKVVQAVERVRQRLLRATAVLDKARIDYAVAGGNAVAAWVSGVDPAAVRFTQDVDIVVRRADFAAVRAAMEAAGFHHAQILNVDMFLDNPEANPRDSVHLLFAAERVKPGDTCEVPDVSQSDRAPDFQVVRLESLVQMKLTAFRDKDRTHLRDMIGVGLIDSTWPARFLPPLAARLQELLDNPEG